MRRERNGVGQFVVERGSTPIGRVGLIGLTLDDLVADDQPVFAMRATGIEDDVVNGAQSECARIVEDFLTLRALVGEQR